METDGDKLLKCIGKNVKNLQFFFTKICKNVQKKGENGQKQQKWAEFSQNGQKQQKQQKQAIVQKLPKFPTWTKMGKNWIKTGKNGFKKNIAGCWQNRLKLEKMAKYSKWADIAKTGVNVLNCQKCVKTNKNYHLKTKKQQAETGRNKNNRQK